jgi:DNA invertase Pin-like site-specific DNA recombinase
MKAAIYARVNTSNNGQDPTMQTRELREYCERHRWAVAGEYVDIGISGTKEKRPELDRLMGDAHRRRFDAVVVWKFDRFARSVSHLLRALETFKAQGIEFVSFSEQLDTPHPRGSWCSLCWGPWRSWSALSSSSACGPDCATRAAKGKSLGRPRVSVDAARIASLRLQGHSWASIGEQLELGEGTVRRTAAASAKKPLKTTPATPLKLAAD